MKTIKIILLTTLLCLLANLTALPQEKIDYEKIIKERYKQAETSPPVVESWRAGMFSNYKLILDHLQITYFLTTESETTDGRILVCGKLFSVGYGKTLDGQKKRVTYLSYTCHLFNKEKLENITVIHASPYIILNGWDDATET